MGVGVEGTNDMTDEETRHLKELSLKKKKLEE